MRNNKIFQGIIFGTAMALTFFIMTLYSEKDIIIRISVGVGIGIVTGIAFPLLLEYYNDKLEKKNQILKQIKSPVSGADELAKFKKLLDDGVITKDEFDEKKKQILEN